MEVRNVADTAGATGKALPLLLCLAAMPVVADDDPALTASRALTQSFGARLQTALQTAMASGGPVAAMRVCKDKAPLIAAQLSRESGAKVSRTSTRFRNPANAPEPWQVAVLEAFAKAKDENTTPLEHLERHTHGTRYMQAITIQPVCLACHGENLAAEVRTVLDEYYPHDRARGYALGELRGAFSISWPVDEAADLRESTVDESNYR